jgi:hypothetical protein
MTKEAIAVYWGFENIHAGLFDAQKGSGSYGKPSNRNRQQDVLVDVNSLYEFAASFGNIAINKAYGNWQWFAKYRQVLLKKHPDKFKVKKGEHDHIICLSE